MIVYVDMDGVLADFDASVAQSGKAYEYRGREDEIPGIFWDLVPIEGAIESFEWLTNHFDTYILSTPSWNKPESLLSKRLWVERYLGDLAKKRLILTHHKNLNVGDFLIDDRLKNGVANFSGEHIHFNTPRFPNWKSVVDYLASYTKSK